jgi:hypothetical protein
MSHFISHQAPPLSLLFDFIPPALIRITPAVRISGFRNHELLRRRKSATCPLVSFASDEKYLAERLKSQIALPNKPTRHEWRYLGWTNAK